MRETRLSKSQERKSQKQLLLSLIGIVVVIVLLIKFGVPLFINFSLFLAGSKTSQTTDQPANTNTSVLLPPTLDPTFSATNSAKVTISGSALPKQSIQLYINNNLVDVAKTKDDGTFTFDNTTLSTGDNVIKVKAAVNNKTSDFSSPITITYKTGNPNLAIDTPSDGQTFSKDQNTIPVSGKTDPGVKVTINDFWAVIDDKGNYTYNLHLQNGDNQIKIDAVDAAGNKTEKQIKVTYNP